MARINGFHSREHGIGAIFEGIVVLDGKRTPFGKFNGALATVNPTDLGILCSRALIGTTTVPASEIDQVLAANIGQASADSFFLPRHIALYSGAALTTPALLAQRICGSGIEVIGLAAQEIGLGKGRLILVAGTENMSRFPLVSYHARRGFALGQPEFVDLLWEALNDTAAVPMGRTADNLAQTYQLSREDVDRFALRSQERYFAAAAAGRFDDEIIAVEACTIEADGFLPRKVKLNRAERLDADENPRPSSLEKLARLPFVFSKAGPTTAGSASGIVDGACAVLLADQQYADAHGLQPLGRIVGYTSVGVEPALMGIGPVPAIKSLLSAVNMTMADVDLIEINEAFGAQCLACARVLELDEDKLNVNGGAVAIGHPLAATGLRLVTTCLKELKRRGKQRGIASACIGGGQGIAMLVEVV